MIVDCLLFNCLKPEIRYETRGLPSTYAHLFLNVGREGRQEFWVDLHDPWGLGRLLLLLLGAGLNALQPQLLCDHLLPDVLWQRCQERGVHALWQVTCKRQFTELSQVYLMV